MTPPEFLVIGYVVQDLAADEGAGTAGWRLGGTASYAAVLARHLGLRTAVLTAGAPDLSLEEAFPEAEIAGPPSTLSTQLRNV